MLRTARRLLRGPFLALCASGAVLAVDAGAAQAATTGTVKAHGSLTVHAAATSASDVVGSVADMTRVSIDCKVNGQYVKGTIRRTTQWDRLMDGTYVSHAYVSVSRSIPACQPPPPPPPAAAPAPSPPPNVSGPLTTISNAAFLDAAAGPAQASQRDFKVPASVTLAQAILESGWGRSKLSFNDRNYFGMKCFGNPGTIASGCHDYVTQECNQTTLACWTIVDSFRVYNSPTDSFRDHGRQLATLTRYRAAFNHEKNPNQFAAEVHKAGYATDPNYTTLLTGVMARFDLYRYDR
jgi:Mannosyl-glycoprotein endo-beta-N-acetylglucosaminidase